MARATGEMKMARFEMLDVASAAGFCGAPATGDTFFALGMMYASGRSIPTDLISAHKWFNLAAMRGNEDAKRNRVELASEMTKAQISAAQKSAREWLKHH